MTMNIAFTLMRQMSGFEIREIRGRNQGTGTCEEIHIFGVSARLGGCENSGSAYELVLLATVSFLPNALRTLSFSRVGRGLRLE
jgi:hypothetical protein